MAHTGHRSVESLAAYSHPLAERQQAQASTRHAHQGGRAPALSSITNSDLSHHASAGAQGSSTPSADIGHTVMAAQTSSNIAYNSAGHAPMSACIPAASGTYGYAQPTLCGGNHPHASYWFWAPPYHPQGPAMSTLNVQQCPAMHHHMSLDQLLVYLHSNIPCQHSTFSHAQNPRRRKRNFLTDVTHHTAEPLQAILDKTCRSGGCGLQSTLHDLRLRPALFPVDRMRQSP